VLINIIYASITEPSLEGFASFLSLFAFYLVFVAVGFIELSIFLLGYPKTVKNLRYQLIFMIIFSSCAATMFLIPDAVLVAISEDHIQSPPYHSFTLLVFTFCFFSTVLIVILSISIKVYNNIQDSALKKKFKLFFIGIVLLCLVPLCITLGNHSSDTFFRQIFSYSMIVAFPGMYFLYQGIGTGQRAISSEK